MICLRIEVTVGSGIEEAVQSALHLAVKLNMIVVFDFNSIEMTVHENSSVAQKVAEYRKRCRSGG